jgi:hypothetical protein
MNRIRVTLELDIDLDSWKEMGMEIAEDDAEDFAKEEFMEWIHAMSDTDIYECMETKYVD